MQVKIARKYSGCSRGRWHVKGAEEVLYKPADTIDNGVNICIGDIVGG